MIDNCPLSVKEQLRTKLKGECRNYNCPHTQECPFWKLRWGGISIPNIRRASPKLIENEIFGVQPMSAPVGIPFSLKYVYKENNDQELSTDNEVSVESETDEKV